VCSIIVKHIDAAEKFITIPTQGAMLFHEENFVRKEWYITTTSGFSSTMPMFLYNIEELEVEINAVTS
jgi:hypothetical protein